MGLLGYTKKTSFKTSLAVAQISEFSLVLLILGNDLGQIDDQTLSMMTLVGLITIAVSSYAILYDEKLYLVFEKYLVLFERRHTLHENNRKQNNELMLFGYKKGGSEFVKVFKSLKKRFVVVDYDPEMVERLEKANINYLYGDITDIELLEEAGIEEAKLIVSVITDYETTKFLLRTVNQLNPNCVIICHADSVTEAAEMYEHGAGYVMLPHYIGSEKISAFIKRTGFKKSEFKKFRNQHMDYLQTHYKSDESVDL